MDFMRDPSLARVARSNDILGKQHRCYKTSTQCNRIELTFMKVSV